MTYRERIIEILQTQTGERKMQISKATQIADALIANNVIVLNLGNWLKNPTGYTNKICSICGGYSFVDRKDQPIKSDYCPNCGAKMDEKGETK